MMRWRLGASTSQSAYARAPASLMNAPAIVVFPVPPLPLRTNSCFMTRLLHHGFQKGRKHRAEPLAFPHGDAAVRIQRAEFGIERNPAHHGNMILPAEGFRRILSRETFVENHAVRLPEQRDQLTDHAEVMGAEDRRLGNEQAVIRILDAFHDEARASRRAIDE